ncbi:AAA family ATPase [Leptospira sp. 96542]|nr:AAA family ATPase [Leptospira sp. 96542]
MNRGLVLGKFYPPHKGHIHLIEEAKKRSDHLTILICSLEKEMIPGSLRFQWLKELCEDKTTEIIWVKDENPQYPNEDQNFWEIWKQSILNHCKVKPDILFTSEEYGEPLSKVLSCKHIAIDIRRNLFPISATEIRNRPTKHWDYIPKPIQPYFLKRIVLTGSESVGKTTMAEKLSKHFNTNWVPEFAREYLESKPTPMDMSDFLPIAEGHLHSENQLAKSANRFLFLDTDLLTTKVYLERYYNNSIPWLTDRALDLKYDLSLFFDIDIPWIADRLRDLGDERIFMRSMFQNAMEDANRPYTFISGSFQERKLKCVNLINRLSEEPMNPIYFNETQRQLRNFG